ncbi:hypothetical protein H8356DRAFT_1329463 [Neocallimastix lanati (nom. inval.)]|nr:hypothetical protein H8356DRAFT_1329463 [Neocallimastix sp. JGI-2020a]
MGLVFDVEFYLKLNFYVVNDRNGKIIGLTIGNFAKSGYSSDQKWENNCKCTSDMRNHYVNRNFGLTSRFFRLKKYLNIIGQ